MTVFGKLSKKQEKSLTSAAIKWSSSTVKKHSKKDKPIITEEMLNQNNIFVNRINWYGKDNVKKDVKVEDK